MSPKGALLFFLLPLLSIPLAAQGRPDLIQSSRVFSGSAKAPARGYFSSPDTLVFQIRAGKARAGRPAALLLSLGRASSPLPIGPDKFELDPARLAGTWLFVLDQAGSWSLTLPVPAGLAPGVSLFFQALVLPKGEPWPVRLSPSQEAALLPGKGHFYVDGDAKGPGTGTPFAPFHTIAAGLSAAAAAGGGTVHVDGLAKGGYAEILYIRSSNTTLLGGDWTGAGQGVPLIQGYMGGSPVDKKRGTINIKGVSPSSLLSKVRIEKFRIQPSSWQPPGKVARGIRADYVKDLVIRDCRVEGSLGGGLESVFGINVGWSTSASIEHCAIGPLAGDPAAGKNYHVTGIKMVIGSGDVTVRNCWIHHLAWLPVKSGVDYNVVGIWDPGIKRLTAANNVIGPMVLPGPAGGANTWTELYGIWSSSPGSIRNNVFHRFDCSAFKSNVKQVAGVWFYRSGPEFTNNIFSDFRLGPVIGVHTIAAAVGPLGGKQAVTYSCVWKVPKPFQGITTGKGVILGKDPLLLPPSYTLKTGSPCLGTGNPLYPPKNMGVWGGPWAGYPGCRW